MRPTIKRKTAGELCLKAASDQTKYDPLEVAHGMCDEMENPLIECVKKYDTIFEGVDEYCPAIVFANDPLLENIKRHKYIAFPYMPLPRPEQVVFAWNKQAQKIKRLWALPNAAVMATISEMQYVAPSWQSTKNWCDAFFAGRFFELIYRENPKIAILDQESFLNLYREKLIQAGCKDIDTLSPDTFDFSKIHINHIVDTKTASLE